MGPLERWLRRNLGAIRNRLRLRRRLRGEVDFGDLRRTAPLSASFGLDRGLPLDRAYIEAFLDSHRSCIRGRVLEVGDARYTRRFGGGVVKSDVLHVTTGNPEATLVGDLASGAGLPDEAFDCAIVVQTLQMIYDFQAAVRTLHRVLAPGGTLLLTTHGISRIGRRLGRDDWGEYWRFTGPALEILFSRVFGAEVEVRPYGNVLTATAFLHGLAADEITNHELFASDPDFEVVIGVRATKPAR
jgi:SAM-dependent methyltransferase